jgi:hypothetical protein
MNGGGRMGMALVVRSIVLTAGALTAGALLMTPAAWSASVLLPRPGQVGLGVQGGYGTLLKSGGLGGTFGEGPTIAVRLRYRMRYERAIGLTFENQRHEIRVAEIYDPVDALNFPGRTRVNAVLSGIEFYQMFGTRTPTVKMLMVGAGIAQTSSRTINAETIYEGDGTFLSAGFGVERFVYRSWALDFSARYMALFLPDDRSHDVQVAAGLMFYASY